MMPPVTSETSCVHRWHVAAPLPGPSGRLMPAHCRNCGAERVYDRAPEPLPRRGGPRRFNPSIAPRGAA